MKTFIFLLICTLSSVQIFSQTHVYNAYAAANPSTNWRYTPRKADFKVVTAFSLKDTYYLNGYTPSGGIDLKATVKFDQYDEWDKLYRYLGEMEMGQIHYTCTLTTKTKLSDFAKGIANKVEDLYVMRINTNFELNFQGTSTNTPFSHKAFFKILPIKYNDELKDNLASIRNAKREEERERREREEKARINSTQSNVKDKSISLANRTILSLPAPKYPNNSEGVVVVKITVDRHGKVTNAEPGVRGSTTYNSQLLAAAKQAALKAIFTKDENAPKIQLGTITYRFVLN